MQAINPAIGRISIPLLSTATPSTSLQDLVDQRDDADRDVAWGRREMMLGHVVNKTGKVAFGLGLLGVGASLLGLGVPFGPALGVTVAGPLLRASGAWITMNGMAKMDKASVRSIGLSQQIAARGGAAPVSGGTALSQLRQTYNRQSPTPIADQAKKAAVAIGSGGMYSLLCAGPAVLSASFGPVGLFAGVVGGMAMMLFASRNAVSDASGAAAITGAAIAGISGGLGFAGPVGVGIATVAGAALGIPVALSVYHGKSEAFS